MTEVNRSHYKTKMIKPQHYELNFKNVPIGIIGKHGTCKHSRWHWQIGQYGTKMFKTKRNATLRAIQFHHQQTVKD